MIRFCNAFAVLMAALCTASTAPALPLVWRADWPDAKPVETMVHRGTDIELQPQWRINKEPADTTGWTFTTYCQTNAVGPWFGPLPGAFFSHTNDVGAASYNVIVRAQTPGGDVNYTAFARLRMLDSPGYAPGVLPLPTQSIDFASIAVTNAPYYTKPETDERIVALAPVPGDYETVSNRASNARSKTDLAVYMPAPWDLSSGTMNGRMNWNDTRKVWVGDGKSLYTPSDAVLYFSNGTWVYDMSGAQYYCQAPEDSLSISLNNFPYAFVRTTTGLVPADDALAKTSQLAQAAQAATNYTDEAVASIPMPDLSNYATHAQATNAARAVTSAAISTNNAAFVEAVLAAPLAGASSGDLSEIGEYGSYGTVGAAILALIAGLAALKRRIGTAETAISGKADSADLRYRIAEAAVRKTLPADCFPVTFTNDGVSYSVNSLVNESEASAVGDMYITDDGDSYSIAMVLSPGTGSEGAQLLDVAYLDAGGVFETSGIQDLQFGGVSPVADTSPTLADIQVLADRTVNLITADYGTASIDIELPAPVEEPTGVRRARDFFLDVDNSMNSGDLALEFTELGVEYLFVTDADDSIGDMMTVSGYGTGQSGDGERVRLYFTECAIEGVAPRPGPIFHVARVTLSAEIDELPTTQGGN